MIIFSFGGKREKKPKLIIEIEYISAHLCQRHKSITRRRLIGNNLDRCLLAQWNGGHIRDAVGAERQLD